MPVQETESEVLLSHPEASTSSVRILKYGATIVSWKVSESEQLWLSSKAHLDGSKAVRGGIPLVFPVFGKGESSHPTGALPQHGFARTSVWEFLGQVDSGTVQFGLGPENLSEEARKQWPCDFTLIFTVSLSDPKTLKTSLRVENTDKAPWEFNVLFHTYFRIPDISLAGVEGLHGLNVIDKVSKSSYVEKSETVSVTGEVDRVYTSSSGEAVTITSGAEPIFKITQRENLSDVVVWNPWTEKANGLSDFEPKTGFKQMVCVENGSVAKFTKIAPGEIWTGSQTIRANL